jgi:hypothetical protein
LRAYCANAPFSANWTSTAWELHIEGAGAGKFSTAMGEAKTWLDFSMQNEGFHHISAEKL